MSSKPSTLPFRDREDAAEQLARELSSWRGCDPLVLAVPRGGVPMGRVIADALDGELDIVQVRKLGAPWNPELAVGAVDEFGHRLASPYAEAAGADERYLQQAAVRELERMHRRRADWGRWRAPADPAGRVVIVVDDGIATGASMMAALHSVARRRPAWLVCAVPVASREGLQQAGLVADKTVCLAVPESFTAVGEWFRDFSDVSDEQVAAALSAPSNRNARATPMSTAVQGPCA